jgi:hypothetical protein
LFEYDKAPIGAFFFFFEIQESEPHVWS